MDDYFEKLFQGLKEYVKKRSVYSPIVTKKAKESVFPINRIFNFK